MSRKVIIPGMGEVDVQGGDPSADAQFIVQQLTGALQGMTNVLGSLLNQMSQQLEMQTRIETGVINKHQLRDSIVAAEKRAEADAQAKALETMEAEMDAQAVAEGDPVTDEATP